MALSLPGEEESAPVSAMLGLQSSGNSQSRTGFLVSKFVSGQASTAQSKFSLVKASFFRGSFAFQGIFFAARYERWWLYSYSVFIRCFFILSRQSTYETSYFSPTLLEWHLNGFRYKINFEFHRLLLVRYHRKAQIFGGLTMETNSCSKRSS
ncbi:LAMI_0G09670g1_1 [Lachancea mirantina]|uniref:LAMI_0G09670g1_1 n=1 Tax=Lachancea mirantina TaxID=1230905 RepID=A0A1G4KAC2_9SACH|nr:LAMI_0G09670g1_1 [Lachancea mirantina]